MATRAGPDTVASHLLILPAEIWASISLYTYGEDFIRLKLTGSKKLWTRLCAKRAVRAITLGQDLSFLKTWPACFNELAHVEELKLCDVSQAWLDSWCPNSGMVPRSLRILIIELPTFQQMSSFENALGKTIKLEECVPFLEILEAPVHWGGWKLPRLTRLSCEAWDPSKPLPDSLIHLSIHDLLFSDAFQFPPHLESFIIGVTETWFYQALPGLPPSLNTLQMEDAFECEIQSQDLAMLPRSLTKLCLEHYCLVGPVSPPDFSIHLKYLEIDSLEAHSWSGLPKTLTTLKMKLRASSAIQLRIGSDYSGQYLPHYPFHQLPKSLTSLEVTSRQSYEVTIHESFALAPQPDGAQERFFPPKLTNLVLKNGNLCYDASKHLPDSITCLVVQKLDKTLCDRLPSGLRALTARQIELDSTLLNRLPTSLTSLVGLSVYSGFPVQIDDNEQEDLEDISGEGKLAFQRIWRGCLPRLRDLVMVVDFDLGDLSEHHLPNLQKLKLRTHRREAIPRLPISQLCRHLQSVEVDSTFITGRDFDDLPRSLTYLSLNHSVHIYDTDIKSLPPTLLILSLNAAIHLTDASVKELPKCLREFNCTTNTTITPSAVPDLPTAIRSSQNTYSFVSAKWRLLGGKVKLLEIPTEYNQTP